MIIFYYDKTYSSQRVSCFLFDRQMCWKRPASDTLEPFSLVCQPMCKIHPPLNPPLIRGDSGGGLPYVSYLNILALQEFFSISACLLCKSLVLSYIVHPVSCIVLRKTHLNGLPFNLWCFEFKEFFLFKPKRCCDYI